MTPDETVIAYKNQSEYQQRVLLPPSGGPPQGVTVGSQWGQINVGGVAPGGWMDIE